jgi:hypothetical protein
MKFIFITFSFILFNWTTKAAPPKENGVSVGQIFWAEKIDLIESGKLSEQTTAQRGYLLGIKAKEWRFLFGAGQASAGTGTEAVLLSKSNSTWSLWALEYSKFVYKVGKLSLGVGLAFVNRSLSWKAAETVTINTYRAQFFLPHASIRYTMSDKLWLSHKLALRNQNDDLWHSLELGVLF